MSLTISAEQREALYEQIVDRLSGIDDVWLAIRGEDYEAARRLAQRYSDDLRLIDEGLGWGEGGGGPVELSMPPDALRRTLTRLRDEAAGLDASEHQEEQEVEESRERHRLVMEACGQVLADLRETATADP
jgi:hypothetical protein